MGFKNKYTNNTGDGIVNKDAGAKIISLYKSKNAVWVLLFTLLILVATLTSIFILKDNNHKEKKYIIIKQPLDTAINKINQTANIVSASATISLNTSAIFIKKDTSSVYKIIEKKISFNKKKAPNYFFNTQVVNADNLPLPFANIAIRKENFGTYSDVNGMIRLTSKDSILNIEVKSIGYQSITSVLVYNKAQSKIELHYYEEVKNLESPRVTIITDINSCAEPIDGWKNYNTYVANNLDLPKSNINKRLEGIVEFSFNVRLDGTIYNIQFYKSMGALYDEATKRMFMEGPKWKIKNLNTQTVRVQVHF